MDQPGGRHPDAQPATVLPQVKRVGGAGTGQAINKINFLWEKLLMYGIFSYMTKSLF